MNSTFTKYHKALGLFLIFSAILVIPLSAGVVLMTQFSRPTRSINAQTPTVNKCDFAADGVVDQKDIALAAKGFGRVVENAGNSVFDLNNDNWVNSHDIDIITYKNPQFCK